MARELRALQAEMDRMKQGNEVTGSREKTAMRMRSSEARREDPTTTDAVALGEKERCFDRCR